MDNRKNIHNELVEGFKVVHHRMPLWVLSLILISLIFISAYHASDLIVILLLSGVLAYILSSVINKMQSLGLKRKVAVVLLYMFLFGLVIGGEALLSPYLRQEIGNFYERVPEFSQQIENIIKQQSAENSKDFTVMEQLIRKLLREATLPGRLINKTLDFSAVFGYAAPFVLGLVLTPFFVFFLLKDWPEMLKRIMKWIPPAYVETTVSAMSEMNILVGRYLRGLAVDCFAVGVLATSGLWLLGIHYPITLGILSGCANVIPYMGPVIACISACLIAFIQFQSTGAVINVLLLYITIKLLDDLLIQPLAIGKTLSLHPMLLVISIVTGEKLFGVIGMILAVPIVTISQKIITIFFLERRKRPIAKVDPEAAGRIIV
jgi:predicted PurR-regulated permease PerM